MPERYNIFNGGDDVQNIYNKGEELKVYEKNIDCTDYNKENVLTGDDNSFDKKGLPKAVTVKYCLIYKKGNITSYKIHLSRAETKIII